VRLMDLSMGLILVYSFQIHSIAILIHQYITTDVMAAPQSFEQDSDSCFFMSQ
jgi:hypothetical protein